MQEIVFWQNVTLIGDCAFHTCNSLWKVILPDSIRRIEDETFADYCNLEEIIFRKNIAVIGKRAFHSCKVFQIALPDSVVRLREDAFGFCCYLHTFKNSKNVTRICDETFSCCRSLSNVDLEEEVTFICEKAFKCCEKLKKLFIPGSICVLEKQSFKDAGLEEVTIGRLMSEGNVEIKFGVFDGCKNLSSIHFDKNFSIGRGGLGRGLRKLEKVTWQEDCKGRFEEDAIILGNEYYLNQSSREAIKNINPKAIKVIRRRFL